MEKLIFEAPYLRVYEPTAAQLDAAKNIPSDIKDKPRFCVDMMLAVLDIENTNNHRLKRVEVDKALAALGDKQNVPGNLDHSTGAYGTSISLFVASENKVYPELWLSAVYWRRYISDAQLEEIIKAAKNKTLGASWEIDADHYTLEADKDNPSILDVKDFSIDGFGLMVGKTPAEKKTQGTATITAQEEDLDSATEEDKKKQKARSSRYGIGIKEGGNVTKPGKYASVPDSKFSDPVNYKYPIDKAHIRPAVSYFNQGGQREAGGYTSAEWAKMGRRIARAAGKGYTYKDGVIVTPATKEAGMESEHEVMEVDTYGELRVDMLRAIRCPTCGDRGKVRKLNFVDGIFEMECRNGEYDRDKISHIYEVSIAVKPQGQAAEYRLTASEEAVEDFVEDVDDDQVIEVVLKQTNEEVHSMEFTEEQQKAIDDKVKELMNTYMADQEKKKDAQAKREADNEAEIEKRVKEAEEKAGTEAVAVYKKMQETAAKRFDELSEIMPYESEEEKVAERDKIAAMADERYEEYKERRTLLATIAEMKKASEGDEEDEEEEEETPEGDKVKADMPAGNLSASKKKTNELDFGALARM